MPKEDPIGPGGGADQDRARGYVPKKKQKKTIKGQLLEEKALDEKVLRQSDDEIEDLKKLQSYKKGGIVKKTGVALVHKGERVIPAKKETATERFIRVRNAKEAKGRR
ncbi:hypothetical protein M0Q28_05660 [Patescibacteria group bacterium]|jgi:hypothetical protein|nr:hypothetical protein [Patescibacteria group bacterium]